MSDLTTVEAGGAKAGGFAGSLGRAIRVLFAPSRVFADLERRPEWLAPLIICILVAILSAVILIPSVIQPEQRAKLEERGLTEEQLEAAGPWLAGGRMLIIGIVTSIVGTPIAFLIVAGVLHLVCGLIMGGQANFVRTFCVVAFASMVKLPESIVKVPLSLASKSAEVQTSLALLMTRDPAAGFASRFAYNLLGHIDIFALWEVFLVVVGVAAMFKFSRQKSYYAVGGLWVVYILLASAVASIMPGAVTVR
jgi:hypothetical protein